VDARRVGWNGRRRELLSSLSADGQVVAFDSSSTQLYQATHLLADVFVACAAPSSPRGRTTAGIPGTNGVRAAVERDDLAIRGERRIEALAVDRSTRRVRIHEFRRAVRSVVEEDVRSRSRR